MKDLRDYLLIIAALVIFCAVIYGFYYIGKAVSYSFFYEDMVQDSIEELVKGGCLK